MRGMLIRVPCIYNRACYPVIFEGETVLNRVLEALRRQDVFPRRSFQSPPRRAAQPSGEIGGQP